MASSGSQTQGQPTELQAEQPRPAANFVIGSVSATGRVCPGKGQFLRRSVGCSLGLITLRLIIMMARQSNPFKPGSAMPQKGRFRATGLAGGALLRQQ